MARWREEIRRVLIHPDPQYIVSSVAWLVLIVVFAAVTVVRFLGW